MIILALLAATAAFLIVALLLFAGLSVLIDHLPHDPRGGTAWVLIAGAVGYLLTTLVLSVAAAIGTYEWMVS